MNCYAAMNFPGIKDCSETLKTLLGQHFSRQRKEENFGAEFLIKLSERFRGVNEIIDKGYLTDEKRLMDRKQYSPLVTAFYSSFFNSELSKTYLYSNPQFICFLIYILPPENELLIELKSEFIKNIDAETFFIPENRKFVRFIIAELSKEGNFYGLLNDYDFLNRVIPKEYDRDSCLFLGIRAEALEDLKSKRFLQQQLDKDCADVNFQLFAQNLWRLKSRDECGSFLTESFSSKIDSIETLLNFIGYVFGEHRNEDDIKTMIKAIGGFIGKKASELQFNPMPQPQERLELSEIIATLSNLIFLNNKSPLKTSEFEEKLRTLSSNLVFEPRLLYCQILSENCINFSFNHLMMLLRNDFISLHSEHFKELLEKSLRNSNFEDFKDFLINEGKERDVELILNFIRESTKTRGSNLPKVLEMLKESEVKREILISALQIFLSKNPEEIPAGIVEEYYNILCNTPLYLGVEKELQEEIGLVIKPYIEGLCIVKVNEDFQRLNLQLRRLDIDPINLRHTIPVSSSFSHLEQKRLGLEGNPEVRFPQTFLEDLCSRTIALMQKEPESTKVIIAKKIKQDMCDFFEELLLKCGYHFSHDFDLVYAASEEKLTRLFVDFVRYLPEIVKKPDFLDKIKARHVSEGADLCMQDLFNIFQSIFVEALFENVEDQILYLALLKVKEFLEKRDLEQREIVTVDVLRFLEMQDGCVIIPEKFLEILKEAHKTISPKNRAIFGLEKLLLPGCSARQLLQNLEGHEKKEALQKLVNNAIDTLAQSNIERQSLLWNALEDRLPLSILKDLCREKGLELMEDKISKNDTLCGLILEHIAKMEKKEVDSLFDHNPGTRVTVSGSGRFGEGEASVRRL